MDTRRALAEVPIKVCPDIGAPPDACLTNEQRVKIGQPNMVRPPLVGSINQKAANA